MRLNSLTVQGFKSFGNRVSIEFAPGVTAIVGPNGSGKSNVIDALRWTTGGGRASHYRASDKTDLIFHGASGKRSVGLAEVEVELVDGARSVKVYRSLDRDGNTRLRLDGKAARFFDVEEALAGSGLGRSGLAIIGQGEVSQVLMADPARLLEYVAEAAGVARLAGRRDQTVARLETATRHLERLQDVLGELATRSAQLEQEAHDANRHAELAAEQLLLRYTLARLRRDALADEIRGLEVTRGLLEAALAEGRTRLGELRAQGRLAATAREEAEARYREASAQLEFRRGNLRVAEERLARLEERDAAAQRAAGAMRAELQRLALVTRPEQPGESLREASARAEAAASQERLGDAALQSAAELERARRSEYERARTALVESEREAAGRTSRREALAARLSQLESRLDELRREGGAGVSKELHEHQARSEERLTLMQGRVEAQRARLQRSHEQHALAAAEAASRRAAAGRSRQAFEARRGFAEGPRNALTADIPGVVGPVADLLQVAPEYREAVTAALGRRAEYVVVDRAETGEAVLRHVRRAGGFVTVLPLDLMRDPPERSDHAAGRLPGIVAAAMDLVTVEGRYRALVDGLLGNTLVVEDLEAATAIARRPGGRPRLVTLSGELIEPSGAMSGGKRSQHATVLGAAAELEEAEAAVLTAAAAAEVAAEEFAREQAVMRELLAEQESAAEDARAASHALAAARERSAGHERLLADLNAQHGQASAELTSLPVVKGDPGALADAVTAAQRALDQAVAELESVRSAQGERRLAAARATQAARTVEERWQRFAEAEAGYREAAARSDQLRAELDSLTATLPGLALEIADARAACDLARAAVPVGLEAEEGALEAAQGALRELEAALTGETEAQARRAQELEDAKVQTARRETALELAYEELAAFPEGLEPLDVSERAARARLREVAEALEALGAVNHRAVADLEETRVRLENLEVEAVQATLAVAEIEAALLRIDKETTTRLGATLSRLQTAFARHVQQLFGAEARGGVEVELEGDRPVGVRIRLQPPGKQTQSLHLLSVGERTMGALAFLFSLLTGGGEGLPVAVLDEVDAPLDEANIRRFGAFVTRLAAQGTQFVLITHQKATFEIAETLWGVTTEQGVSRVFGIRKGEEVAV